MNIKRLEKAIKTAYICYIENNTLKIYTYEQVNNNKPYFEHTFDDAQMMILKTLDIEPIFFTYDFKMFMNKNNYFIVKDSLNKIKTIFDVVNTNEECEIYI